MAAKPSAKVRRLLADLPAFRSLACAFDAGAEEMGDVADRLGRLAALRAQIETYEAKLKEVVIENGEAAIEGRTFRTTLSVYEESRLDTKRIREEMDARWLKRFSLEPKTIRKVTTRARIGTGLGEEAA